MINLSIYEQVVEKLSLNCKLAFPQTIDELIANYGPKTILSLANICKQLGNDEEESYLLDAAKQSTKLFQLFCHDSPPLNPKLRKIDHFFVGQKIMSVSGFNKILHAFHDISDGEIISIQNVPKANIVHSSADFEGKSIKKIRLLTSPCLMAISEYDYLVKYPQYVESFFKENRIGGYSSKPADIDLVKLSKESIRNTSNQVDQERYLATSATPKTAQNKPVNLRGLLFINGIKTIHDNGKCFVPCNLLEDDGDRVVIRIDRSSGFCNPEIITQSSPCKRFISLEHVKELVANEELFSQWLMAFTHRPSSISIAKDYSKSTCYIDEIVLTCSDLTDSDYCVSEEDYLQYAKSLFTKLKSLI